MASGYSSIDSDSYRRSCSGGSRPRTRRRGTYFPRNSKNVTPDYRYSDEDTHVTLRHFAESSNSDLNSLSPGNEERTGLPRDRFDKVREKYKYGQRISSTGNSEDFFHSERDREEDSLGDVFSKHNKHHVHGGKQHASGRANNSSFWEDDNWHDKNETITQKFYSRRGRGGRGRVGGRKVFASHSNTEENPVQLDWREGMTDTSKAVRCFV